MKTNTYIDRTVQKPRQKATIAFAASYPRDCTSRNLQKENGDSMLLANVTMSVVCQLSGNKLYTLVTRAQAGATVHTDTPLSAAPQGAVFDRAGGAKKYCTSAPK